MPMSSTESTKIIEPVSVAHIPGARWQPFVGHEALGVVDRKQLPGKAGEKVLEAAASILSRGLNPETNDECHTGLVVGYVQSGKTLSFTTVMAMARDNEFKFVITVAGISTPLLDQSRQRLANDLNLQSVSGSQRWKLLTNPTVGEYRDIKQALDTWLDSTMSKEERPTVLITVMKNHRHLSNLVKLMNKLKPIMGDAPTLIIDDEADQASLNTLVNRGRESTTYRRLLELREAVPNHTFLQYTATPQAPLLINIIDSLSPDFVEVLEPGRDYVGGRAFFSAGQRYGKLIPPGDIPSDNNALTGPPNSLRDAIRIFLVGVAAGIIQGEINRNQNRSMLVHPSREVARHQEYKIWIDHIFDEWQRLLGSINDPDHADLLDDFSKAHAELSTTVKDIPPFDEIVTRLPSAFRQTRIKEVNTRQKGETPKIDWNQQYAWVLVGGQAMDRGFTVEGLTVTYMPRGPGVGNADAIQQRGRFFGYKGSYLGYCRAYLEQDVLSAFEGYVRHEEEMRKELQRIRDEGGSLSDWKRVFFLARDLAPCRNSVVQIDYARGGFANKWFRPKRPHIADTVFNRELAKTYIESLELQTVEGIPERYKAQKHKFNDNVRLVEVYDQLLVPYQYTFPQDSLDFTGLLLQLKYALDQNPDEMCTVYHMSPNFKRDRSLRENGQIRQLFQGELPESPKRRGEDYPGDRRMRTSENVTVQLHFLDLFQDKVKAENIVATDVPVTAIWIPRRLGIGWITQDQS